ncbi:MAG: hypothetical protein AB1413_03120 [Thermodesulfobacteriota bacterium]
MAPELDTTTPQLARALVGQRTQALPGANQRQSDQQLRQAESRRQDAAQRVRAARADVQDASRRLQEAMAQEQQAGQQVRAARAEQQQALQNSQTQTRGTFVSVLI